MARKFSEEYKEEAVKTAIRSGASLKQVSKDLGIGESTLSRWVLTYKYKHKGGEISIEEREEIKQLKAEIHKLKLERDLLKKATIFFANNRHE